MMEIQYNLVVPKLSKTKRNTIVIGGFIGGLALIALVYFVTNIIIPILWFAVVYGLILMALSGYLLGLKQIGTVKYGFTQVHLQNPELGMEKMIEVNEIKSVLVRKGLATNMVIGIKRKTLIIDLTTNEDETISMQIEVKGKDVDTSDQLDKYFQFHNISSNRKI